MSPKSLWWISLILLLIILYESIIAQNNSNLTNNSINSNSSMINNSFNITNITNISNETLVEIEVLPQYKLPKLEYQMSPEQKYKLDNYGIKSHTPFLEYIFPEISA